MVGRVPGGDSVGLDKLLNDAYHSRGRWSSRYSVARAKRWLGYVAAYTKRYPAASIDATVLRSRAKTYSFTNGLTRGGTIGFVVPMVVLLTLLGLFELLGDDEPKASDFTPNTDPIKHHFLDGPLGPAYWLVSRLLLFYRNRVWAPLLGGDLLATDWDWVLSVVCLVVTTRLILLPLVVKQVRSQQHVRRLQPKVRELQERHRGDRETLQRELMELYKTENANPLMGFLSVLVQVPAFFALYHVVSRLDPAATDEEASRFGWTAAEFHDAATARVFGAPVVETFAADGHLWVLVVVGPLVLVWMALSYINAFSTLTSKGGWSHDSQQRAIQLSIVFGIPALQPITVLFVPAGVVVYMLSQTCCILAQRQWIDWRCPEPRLPIRGRERPDGIFGMTALLAFGAVAMLTYPVGALALTGGLVGLVLIAVVLAALAIMVGLREWVGAAGGGAGPIAARRFLNDACDRQILRRASGRKYHFRQDWVRDQLAIAYGRAAERYRRVHPMPRYVPATGGGRAAYATGRLMGPDEWAMNGAEKLDEFL